MEEQLYSKPLFEDFSEAEMQDLLHYSQSCKFNSGDYLFKQGELSRSIYIIFSGSVELSAFNNNNEEVFFPPTGNGTVLGEIAFFDGNSRTASAKAVNELETIVISYDDFNKLEKEKSDLAIKVLKELGRITAERLRWADDLLVDIIR